MNSILRKSTAALAAASIVVSMVAPLASVNAAMDSAAAEKLASLGVIVSQSNSADYRLGDSITRREMLKVMMKLSNINVEETCEGKFADLQSSDWGCKYAETALANGMIAANANFRPDDQVSKIESLKMIFKGLGIEREENSDWKAGYVNTAVAQGLVSNFSDYDTSGSRGFIFSGAANGVEVEEETMEEDDLDLGGLFGDLDDEEETTSEETTSEETTSEETTSEETDTTTPVYAEGDVLEVTLSPETPNGSTVPGNASIELASFDFTAGEEDVEVKSITLKRTGLASDDVVTEIALFTDTARVSKGRDFNSSTDDVVLNLSPSVVVKAGSTETVTVVGQLGASGTFSGEEFAISILEIDSTTSIEGSFPIMAETFKIGGVDAASVTISVDSSISSVKIGEDSRVVSSFEIDNNSNDEDVTISSITLENKGGADLIDALANITLFSEGTEVATSESSDDYITFNLAEGVVVNEGNNVSFEVKADIIGEPGKTIEFILDKDLDVVGTGSKYGFGISVTNSLEQTDVTAFNIAAGELTMVDIDPTVTKIREDKDDLVLGKIKIMPNSGKNLEIENIKIVLDAQSLPTDTDGDEMLEIFENIELYDETNGNLYTFGTSDVTDNTDEFTDGVDDLVASDEVNISLSGETTLVVRADTKNGLAAAGVDLSDLKFRLRVDYDTAGSTFNIIETEDDTAVTSVTPSSLTFKSIEGTVSTGDIYVINQSNTTVVQGQKEVVVMEFEVEADEASDLIVDEFVFEAIAGGVATGDNDTISEIKLFKDSVDSSNLIETNPGTDLADSTDADADSEITFNDFDKITIVKSTKKSFYLVVSIVDNDDIATGTLTFEVQSASVDDEDNDPVTLNEGGAALAEGNPAASERTVSIVGNGSLNIAVDNSDTDTNSIINVVAGETSSEVASFEFTATNEAIIIEDLELNQTNGGVVLKDAVKEVILYTADGTEIARESVSADDKVTFTNINYTIEEGSENVYVKILAHKIGKNEAGASTAALDLNLEVTDAYGSASNKDLSAGNVNSTVVAGEIAYEGDTAAITADSLAFNVVSVDLVDPVVETLSTLTLKDGSATTAAKVTLVPRGSNNTDADDGSELVTKIETIRFKVKTATNLDADVIASSIELVRIDPLDGSTNTVAASEVVNVTGGTVSNLDEGDIIGFDLSSGFSTNDELDTNGVTYEVRVNANVTTTTSDAYLELEMVPAASAGSNAPVEFGDDDNGTGFEVILTDVIDTFGELKYSGN